MLIGVSSLETTIHMNSGILKLVSIALFSTVLLGCKSNTGRVSDKQLVVVSGSETKDNKRSIFEKLKESKDLTVYETIALYHQLKKEAPNEYNFENEQELNKYGYALLSEGETKAAIEIFKLLVAEFPKSANPYDSLGEAYLKDGNDDLALENYEKSIKIDPKNNHAIDQVTILKGLELLVTDWGKEFFHFPLHFAEEIRYQGVEEVVFPKNWIKQDSSDFWSYVFVWALENKQAVTEKELETNLKLYFDGLISGLSRVDTTKLTKTSTQFQRNENPKDSVSFIGNLNIFDGFATQKPLNLNARIYSDYCKEKDQLILLFRFSPQPFDHPIWDKLRTVTVRPTVCEKSF